MSASVGMLMECSGYDGNYCTGLVVRTSARIGIRYCRMRKGARDMFNGCTKRQNPHAQQGNSVDLI